MKNKHFLKFIQFAAAVAMTVFASALDANASNSCRNVQFKVRSDRDATIVLKRVKYFGANDKVYPRKKGVGPRWLPPPK